MMTVESVYQAERLIGQRAKVATAKWAHVAVMPENRGSFAPDLTEVDEELALAIEEFRARKLTAIDDQLRALGVEPPA